MALHKSFGTYVAQIAEVELTADKMPKVIKMWCAVDCGVAINPNIITAQMEGGIGYGLGLPFIKARPGVSGGVAWKG